MSLARLNGALLAQGLGLGDEVQEGLGRAEVIKR